MDIWFTGYCLIGISVFFGSIYYDIRREKKEKGSRYDRERTIQDIEGKAWPIAFVSLAWPLTLFMVLTFIIVKGCVNFLERIA